MVAAAWKRLWRMHSETKPLVLFRPEEILSRCAGKFGFGEGEEREYARRQKVGLVLGPALFLLMLLAPMEPAAGKMAAVAILMACWWICESLPLPATSLLPIALFPLLGIMDARQATAPYASDPVFLFMGGFIIALAMERRNLHRRVALNIIRVVGFAPDRLILGFMASTAVLSAFVSNAATVVMMLPVALAIIGQVVEEGKKEGLDRKIDFSPGKFAFGLNLMLGIAYGASIGGLATLIGSPPNMVLAAYLQEAYGFEIGFVDWMKVGVPLVAFMLPLSWLWLTRVANPMKLERVPGGRDLIDRQLGEMGPMSAGERLTALVFLLTALGWIFRRQLEPLYPGPGLLTDGGLAMAGALALFLIPTGMKNKESVMDRRYASGMPWGALLLLGGGLSMAGGVERTGLADWIVGRVGLLGDAPTLMAIVAATVLIIALTEMTSSAATAAMSMPILSAAAIGLGQNPLLLLVPAAIASSCAFSMPAATAPNAVVFGSGYLRIPQMARSGLGINLLGILLILVVTHVLVIPVFDVVLNELPAWVVPR